MSICLDQYIMTKEDLNALNPGSNKDSYRTCNHFRKNINAELLSQLEMRDVRAASHLNPKPNVNVLTGCCNIKDNAIGVNKQNLNSRDDISSQVFNISTARELDNFLLKKKETYISNWNNIKGVLNLLASTSFSSIRDQGDTLSKRNLKNTKEQILFLLRDIISIEEDVDKVDKISRNLNVDAGATKTTYDLSNENYKKERKLIKEFREKKEESKNQKLQYFDKQNFIWYNNVFYLSLIIISSLFIRNQIRSK